MKVLVIIDLDFIAAGKFGVHRAVALEFRKLGISLEIKVLPYEQVVLGLTPLNNELGSGRLQPNVVEALLGEVGTVMFGIEHIDFVMVDNNLFHVIEPAEHSLQVLVLQLVVDAWWSDPGL